MLAPVCACFSSFHEKSDADLLFLCSDPNKPPLMTFSLAADLNPETGEIAIDSVGNLRCELQINRVTRSDEVAQPSKVTV